MGGFGLGFGLDVVCCLLLLVWLFKFGLWVVWFVCLVVWVLGCCVCLGFELFWFGFVEWVVGFGVLGCFLSWVCGG